AWQVARGQRHRTYQRPALPPDDAGQDRAISSRDEKPDPAGQLLPARTARTEHRGVRQLLQQLSIPREPGQPDAGKRRVKAKLREDRPATRSNETWAMDFVHDQLATGTKSACTDDCRHILSLLAGDRAAIQLPRRRRGGGAGETGERWASRQPSGWIRAL